jgi:hypothetical protein
MIVSKLGLPVVWWVRIMKKESKNRIYDLRMEWWYRRVFWEMLEKKKNWNCWVTIYVPECWLYIITEGWDWSPSISLDILHITFSQSLVSTALLLHIRLIYYKSSWVDIIFATARCYCSQRVSLSIPVSFISFIVVSFILFLYIFSLATYKFLLLDPTFKYKSQLLHLLNQLIYTLPHWKYSILIFLRTALALIAVVLILLL